MQKAIKHKHTFKIVTSIIMLTAFIIGMSIFTQWLLNRDSLRLEQAIEEIEKSAKIEEWGQAEASLKNVNDIWSDVKGTWSALIDHQEIDNIDVTLSRLQMLVQAKEVPSSLSEAAALRKYIGHIPAKEKLSFDNLF